IKNTFPDLDPTFSKLFGKSVRIDRIHGLANAVTYERQIIV
nr:DNA-binding protein SMUBP-2 [Tanacetum cinerariifolium]